MPSYDSKHFHRHTLNPPKPRIDKSKLSSDGQQLISDFQSIIETARQMIMQKNEDELFQNFLYCEFVLCV